MENAMTTHRAMFIVGVMGGGDVPAAQMAAAYRLGSLIAAEGWVLLNGGRRTGVMQASAQGACESGGLVVGILPDEDDRQASAHVHIPILTGMGSARNCINVLSSQVVVACRGGAGTISEVALALKYQRPVVLMDFDLRHLFPEHATQGRLIAVATPEAAIAAIKDLRAALKVKLTPRQASDADPQR